MKHRAAINVVGKSNLELPPILAGLAESGGASIEFCRFYTFGDLAVATMVLAGEWAMPAKVEKLVESLEAQYDLRAIVRQITDEVSETQQLALNVQVVAGYSKEVINNILEFFKVREMKVVDMYVEKFLSSHSTVVMMTHGLTVVAATDVRLNLLRDDFLLYCDELNVDGMIELEKA